MTALLFLDTETTGLHPERDEIWEIAAILRDDEGAEKSLHLFVDHAPDLCGQLPEEFWEDHRTRYPFDCQTGYAGGRNGTWRWEPRSGAAKALIGFMGGVRPLLVGAVPSFDTERLGRLIYATQGPFTRMPWHYHVQDVETLIVGYLRAEQKYGPWREEGIEKALTMPYDSDLLSRAIGVDPQKYDRHTAMGDVLWVRDQWDAVMGTAPTDAGASARTSDRA